MFLFDSAFSSEMRVVHKAAEVKGTEADGGAAWEKAQLSLHSVRLHSGSALKQFAGARAGACPCHSAFTWF